MINLSLHVFGQVFKDLCGFLFLALLGASSGSLCRLLLLLICNFVRIATSGSRCLVCLGARCFGGSSSEAVSLIMTCSTLISLINLLLFKESCKDSDLREKRIPSVIKDSHSVLRWELAFKALALVHVLSVL